MSAPRQSNPPTAVATATRTRPASEYADQMPRLRRYASLPPADPRRAELRQQLILAFLPVVDHLARRHDYDHRVSRDDLVQIGTIGLINAIDRWDPQRARGDFLGYLVPSVRGEMLRYYRDHTWSTRVPRRLKDLTIAINRATGPLSQQLGRAPRASELARHLEIDRDEVIAALEARSGYLPSSLDAVSTETGTPLAERLGELDKHLDNVEYRHALRALLGQLSERDRTVIMLRFFGEMTQTQIAQLLGISQMQVSRLLSRILEWLRTSLLDDNPPTEGHSFPGTL